jgi:hypothetical protein
MSDTMAAKFTSRTKWREKLERGEAKVVPIPPKWEKRFGKGKIVIPTPLEVDALIRKVRKGRVATRTQLREYLAREHGAKTTCPLCTGIFIRIVAEAAEEARQEGRKRITPYWRIVAPDGSLNEKIPGGAKDQARRLREEGHKITPSRGKKPPKVANFEGRLAKL